MSSKFLFIAHKFDKIKRSSYLVTKRFTELFPDTFEIIEDNQVESLGSLNEKYDKLIFISQALNNYSIPVNLVSVSKLKHLIYLRQNYNHSLYNSANNGFHYYQNYKGYKNYIPFITDFKVEDKKLKNPCIGFYIRKQSFSESFRYAVWMVNNLKYPVDVCTMGDPIPEFMGNAKTYTHTYDNKTFFENITHFVYPQTKEQEDMFPHCLLEAVHTGKQIVLPVIEGRKFKDGIDDIKEFIGWHEELNFNVDIDNSECPLTFSNFKKFYERTIENNFEYHLDRDKYKTFKDWFEREVI